MAKPDLPKGIRIASWSFCFPAEVAPPARMPTPQEIEVIQAIFDRPNGWESGKQLIEMLGSYGLRLVEEDDKPFLGRDDTGEERFYQDWRICATDGTMVL